MDTCSSPIAVAFKHFFNSALIAACAHFILFKPALAAS